jgi:hypothetical protein
MEKWCAVVSQYTKDGTISVRAHRPLVEVEREVVVLVAWVRKTRSTLGAKL